jgi:hypothetical protein
VPIYTFHITQLLDVACFNLSKTAYSQLVLDLVRQGILYIDKADFLTMYQHVRGKIFIESEIENDFKATGLVPYNLRRVLDTLLVYIPLLLATPYS